MKFWILGRDTRDVEGMIVRAGLALNEKKPDIVFCIGGDGTILVAENTYPSVPKVAIRKSEVCKKCEFDGPELKKAIQIVAGKKYGLKEYMKIDAECKGKKFSALNEVQVHNENPAKAIRFSILVDGKVAEENVIGDGIVISTPYGSQAYYYSVGGEPFERGIGLGFNNPHRRIKSRVVPEGSRITVKILRGKAKVFADNTDRSVSLAEGDELEAKKSESTAKFVVEK